MPITLCKLVPGLYMLPVAAHMFARLGSQARHTLRADFRLFVDGKEPPFWGNSYVIEVGSHTIQITELVVGRSAFSLGYCRAWGPHQDDLLFVIAFALSTDKEFAFESLPLN